MTSFCNYEAIFVQQKRKQVIFSKKGSKVYSAKKEARYLPLKRKQADSAKKEANYLPQKRKQGIFAKKEASYIPQKKEARYLR